MGTKNTCLLNGPFLTIILQKDGSDTKRLYHESVDLSKYTLTNSDGIVSLVGQNKTVIWSISLQEGEKCYVCESGFLDVGFILEGGSTSVEQISSTIEKEGYNYRLTL